MPTGKHQAPPQTEGPWVSCEESGLLPSQVVTSFLPPQLSGAWLWDLRSESERKGHPGSNLGSVDSLAKCNSGNLRLGQQSVGINV